MFRRNPLHRKNQVHYTWSLVERVTTIQLIL
nr:MAG TPA: hypothetical protein [Caudoviricetes sp.]DAR34390.1 MAG TPA: hypothetical protein [Caudoviricetes sp.]